MVMSLGIAVAHAAPVHLRTNQRVNPLGIDSVHPELSWQSDSTARNWTQSAYQVLVASSLQKLSRGDADIWDSGKLPSSKSVNISYSGPELTSRRRYFWVVRTWDAQGHEESSPETAWWEMGLLQPTDWSAQWIRRTNAEEQDVPAKTSWIWLPTGDPKHVQRGVTVEFKYDLPLDRLPSAATLHILASGVFTARVNGVVTGHKDRWGAFDWEDVRSQLHVGSNQIVVDLTTPASDQPGKTYGAGLAAALLLRDHTKQHWIVTDGTWQVRSLRPAESPWGASRPLGALKDAYVPASSDRESSDAAPDRITSGTALFRKQFTAEKKVTTARLYVTALGSYQAFVNGRPVGQSRLAPGFTDYRKRVLYQTYDVTPLIASGKNVIAAVLGPGWHGSPLLWSGARQFPGPDTVRAQLELTFSDGTRQSVATDSTWETGPSPILSSEIYGGEAYDARLEDPGWKTLSSKKASDWSHAIADSEPAALLVTAQPDLPVHLEQEIAPIAVKLVGSGKTKDAVFDMGQNMVGVATLHVRGPRGTTVKLRFAERLNADGTVYTENLRNADATDHYTLSGHGDETWAPAFTFHGFRYVQVSGYPGKISLSALRGEVLNSLPASPSIRFESSSAILNKMSELGLWGQRGNFFSIPTDCPQRDERMGWMGDAGAFWRTGAYNFDIDAFTHKFMRDVTDGQTADGAFPNIAPNLLQGLGHDPGAPGWGDAGVLVPYATWLQYGDLALLQRNWPAMERWMDFILRTNPDYLRKNDLGPNYADWLAPDPHTPSDLVATAYWSLIAREMQTMAVALGRTPDSEKYENLVSHIQDAYQHAYVHADGSVAGNTQTSYVLTLAMKLAPKELETSMTDRLVRDIKAHQTHLTTGFLGTPFLLSVLQEHGRTDIAYDLLLTSTYPSWGYMVDKGATTWWERWNGDTGDPAMNSYNHYAFGSVMAWVYRSVAGIDADPADPGFHHVVIHPHIAPGLTHVHAEYDSAYGTIKTDWTSNPDGHRDFLVTVPANSTATVFLPAAATDTVKQDGTPVSLSTKNDSLTQELGSGTYRFSTDHK
jgi:alpha-L-rhamnosidase